MLDSLTELKNLVHSEIGFSYYNENTRALEQCLQKRMEILKVSSYADYLKILTKNGEKTELDQLIAELTIGETFFFRHPDQFQILEEKVLPEVIARKQQTKTLRIWSAGCATGEEAYTIALILKNRFQAQLKDWKIKIIGTDVNKVFLDRAARATYTPWSFRDPSQRDYLMKNFADANGSRELRKELREMVQFSFHNLARHPIPSLTHDLFGFDVIFCRNVFIYFAPDTVRQILGKMAQCLAANGWLFLGPSDALMWNSDDAGLVRETTAPVFQRTTEKPAVVPKPQLVQAAPVSAEDPVEIAAWPKAVATREMPQAQDAMQVEGILLAANQGDMPTALEKITHLVEKEPLNAKAHYIFGIFLEDLGQPDAAFNAYRRALYLEPNFAIVLFRVGLTWQRKGDMRRARKHFELALGSVDRKDGAHFLDDFSNNTDFFKETLRQQLEYLGAA